MTTQADVVVVGGGIAGLSVAYFATRAGRRVTIVDEGVERASDLPIALVNPLRGRDGRLVDGGIDGMHATFALVDALRTDGHPIDAGRGLWRPLIGVAGDAATRGYWDTRIAGRLVHEWHDVAPRSLGLVEPVAALRLSEAGWLAPAGLLAALRTASGAEVRADRVLTLRHAGDVATVELARGGMLTARSVVWCGGAWGASLLDPAASDARYKPGSLLSVAAPITAAALTFGVYAAPWSGVATLIGPTREAARATLAVDRAPQDEVARLADRIGSLFGSTMPVREAWRGTRLVRLSSTATALLAAVPTLTALGSRGFLTAPLLASRLVQRSL